MSPHVPLCRRTLLSNTLDCRGSAIPETNAADRPRLQIPGSSQAIRSAPTCAGSERALERRFRAAELPERQGALPGARLHTGEFRFQSFDGDRAGARLVAATRRLSARFSPRPPCAHENLSRTFPSAAETSTRSRPEAETGRRATERSTISGSAIKRIRRTKRG